MYYYIVNPAAGNGKVNRIQGRLISLLKEKRVDGEFTKSIGKGDSFKIARMAIRQGYKNIIAVGGDSTVSEVINGISGSGDVAFGIIPIGNSNITAKLLGITDWVNAINILAKKKKKIVKLAKVNDAYFLNSVHMGFESEIINERTDLNFFKNLVFKKNVIQKLFSFKPFLLDIKFNNDFSISSEIFNLTVKNSAFFSNDSKNSTELEVIISPVQPKIKILKNLSKIISSSYEELPRISKFKTKKIFISSKKKAKRAYADAEYIGETPLEISTTSREINIIINQEKPISY